MTTYLTADTHFGHASIITSCNRLWATTEEMDEALIERWNAVVHPRDVVWHLGDFGYGSPERLASLFGRLNGDKRLILGNHDVDKKGQVSKALRALPWTRVAHGAEITHQDQRIVLDHYAGLAWSAQHYGAFLAFGHSHGKLAALPGSVDVGVDAQGYAPISVEEFIRQADASLEDADARIDAVIRSLERKKQRLREQPFPLFAERRKGRQA